MPLLQIIAYLDLNFNRKNCYFIINYYYSNYDFLFIFYVCQSIIILKCDFMVNHQNFKMEIYLNGYVNFYAKIKIFKDWHDRFRHVSNLGLYWNPYFIPSILLNPLSLIFKN